jgi:hypothetical protein
MKEHSAKSWSKVTCQNRVLAETDCDISASENVTDSPTASVRITARMGKTGATNKRARNGRSGESTPESRIAELSADTQDDEVRSEPSEDGQDDARRAGEQVLDLLKGVDQKKLIALLQSGALEDVMTSQVQGAKKLAKVVQECVYPLLPRDVRDMYDVACYDSNAGFPDWTSAKWTELLESVDPYSEAKPSLDAYPHNPLVNGRARIAPSEALRRFKLPANTKQAVVDSEFKSLQDKQIKPLLRLSMHGLEHAAADLSKIPEESIREYAESAQSLLKLQSQYILYLHADVVRRRKTAAFQALGMTEKEATGEELNPSVSLFGEKDFARMEGTVKLRKEYQDLSRKLGDFKKKPGTGKKKFSKKKQWQSRDSDNTDERTGTSRQEEGEKKETPRQEAKKSPRSTSSSNKGRGGKGK